MNMNISSPFLFTKLLGLMTNTEFHFERTYTTFYYADGSFTCYHFDPAPLRPSTKE